jgi:hypothetical protein
MAAADVLLIGVDGGATEAKAHAAACDDLQRPASFQLRPAAAARVYPRLPGLTPVAVPEQLAQRDAGDIRLSDSEIEQGRLWVEAAAHAVVEVAQQCGAKRVLVGMGMPGLKTPDGRGINTINNGPRIPRYLELLESMIAAAGVELASPVAALGSDADYCGLGEEYAADGLFRDVQNAYYLGGGTGIADAMKLRGRLVPFDAAKPWIQKSWQMPSALGPTFEKLVSASSLNRVWGDLNVAAGVSPVVDVASAPSPAADVALAPRGRRSAPETLHATGPRYPEVAAVRGDPLAAAWLDTAALVLAELIFERLWTIRNGRPSAPHRGEAYGKLNPDHEYRGVLLDRVIIGQRVGLIYADAQYRAVFAGKLDAYLASFIAASGDAELARIYLNSATSALKSGFVRASRLRAAPALGAAVAAVRALSHP